MLYSWVPTNHSPHPRSLPMNGSTGYSTSYERKPFNSWGGRELRRALKHSSGRSSSAAPVCMANRRRNARVAKQLEREIGTLLLTDKIMQNAVSPERAMGLDSAVSALASVTEVELTGDLSVAKVYLSIYSDDHGRTAAMKSLSKLEGYARTHIAKTMRLRQAPEIRFIEDDTFERGEQVLALLHEIQQQKDGARQSTEDGDEDARPGPSPVGGMDNGSSAADVGDGFLDFGEDEEEELEEEGEEEDLVAAFLSGNDEDSKGGNETRGRTRGRRRS